MKNYPFGRRPATPWKIGVGVLLFLAAVSDGTRHVSGGLAGVLGALTGQCILLFGGIALFAAGLPKTLRNPGFVKQRRRRWLKYMGGGFVLMALIAAGLASSGFFDAGALVILFYLCIWTWLSWKIADHKTTIEQLQGQVSFG